MSQRAQSTRSKDGIMLRRRPGMQRMERSRIDRINYKVIGIGPKESPRDKSKERERDKSKERERDKSKERERDKSKDRETDKSQEKEKDGERDKSKDREKEKASTAETEGAEKGHAIRTRLSTGSIHMNGTTTISVAREIENNQRLLGKIADDIPVVPQSTTNRKRSAGAEGLQVPAGGSVPPKRRKIGRNDGSGEDNRNDYFCWLCHKEGTVICCELCPRVYHAKCLELSSNLPKDWACPECEKILRAECIDTRSKSMAMISIDTLCTLLKYALERMQHQGSDPFTKPVDLSNVPYYTDYIFNPMDLSQLERNIKKKMYGCTEAFLADAKWILHNCIIFNGTHHKLTSSAKMIIKICKHEMNEIELCPDCYWNSCIRKNDEWFSETCRTPHTLVWAKLKGYPFWPAKALREMDDQVDVRFFGAHDRSWVSTSQVYMLSKDIPTPAKNKKGGFENAMDELDIHIEKLKEKFGSFQYAPFRTPYDKNHVYFHNKMKQPFRKKGKQPASPKGKAFETRQIGTQVKPKFSLKRPSSDLDKQSMASKTATAVKSKYSSIISTRRAGTVYLVEVPVKKIPVSPDAKSDIVVTEVKDESVKIEDQSEKIESSVGQVSKIVSAPVQVRNEQGTPVLNKEVKSRPSIVDKLQDKIKLMQESEEHEEEEEKENDETNISQVVENPKEVDGGGAQSQNVEFPEPSENTTKEDKDHTSVNVRKEVDDKSEVVKDCSSDRKTSDVLQSATAEEVVQADNKQMDTSDTNDCEKSSESLMEVGSDVSPSKKLYLDNLAKTIQSCKAKLGIPGEKEITDDDALLEESDDDEEEEMEAMEVKEKDDSSKDKEIIKGDNQMEVTSADNNKEEKKSNKEEKNESDDVNSIVKEDKDSTGSTSCDEIKDVASKNSDVSATSSDRETQDVTNNDRETEGVKLDEKKDKNCTETKTNEIVKDDDKSLSTESVSTGTSTEMLKEIGETKKVDVKCQDLKPSDKGLDEPALLMEVESESDSDRLVIDMESDEGLHTIAPSKNISSMIKKASQEKETVADNSKVLKPTEQVQIIGKAGKLYEIIVDKSKSTVNSMDTKQDRQKKPLTAAVKRKSSSDTRQLSSEFFQSAVEKTMRAPEQQTTKKLPEVKAVMLNKVVSKPTSSLDKTQGQVEDVSPSSSSSSSSPSTSKPGSHSEIITKFTKKLMSSIQETFEEMCNEFISTELQPKNITKNLQSEIQKMEWEQQQQVLELKHNFQLTMSEMKACWEAEKQRIVSEVNAMCGKDKEKAIEDTKKKQWCANCGKEAIFYCCWNTSYCDYPCQQAHWPQHMPNCMQSQQQLTTDTESPEKNGQPSSSTASASSADRQMNSQETGSVQQQKTGSTPGVQQGGVDNPVEMDNTLTPSPVRDHVPVGISRQDDQRPRYQYLVGQPGLQPSPAMGLQQAVPIIGGQGNMNMQPMGTGFTPIQPSLGPNQVHASLESVSKRKPGCYNWTEQQMDSACNAILTGGMSVNKAAKVYNVPRVRLAERVSGKPVTLPPNTQPMMTGAQQPIIQYVQPPQPVLSLPPPGVQQFASPPQVGMQTIVQGHPSQAGMVQNRPVVQQNQSVLFPLQVRPHQQPVNVTGGIMPGNIVFTQAGPRSNNPFQVPGRF